MCGVCKLGFSISTIFVIVNVHLKTGSVYLNSVSIFVQHLGLHIEVCVCCLRIFIHSVVCLTTDP
jgi:hypothetical protein